MAGADHMRVFDQMVADPAVRKFVATMRDKQGNVRKFHLTGPDDSEHAEAQARQAFHNFEFVGIEEVDRGPLKQMPIPQEAFTNGIKENIHSKRLR